MNKNKVLIAKLLMACVSIIIAIILEFTLDQLNISYAYEWYHIIKALYNVIPLLLYLLVDFCFDKEMAHELEVDMLKKDLKEIEKK